MGFLATALIGIGGIIMLVGGIWVLVIAFQESVLWGLGSLFIPFVSLIFVAMHWDKAGKPFLISLAGLVPYLIGVAMAASAAAG